MTRRRDPCNVIIVGLLAVLFGAIALAFVMVPPSRPCPVGSLERAFTHCEARP